MKKVSRALLLTSLLGIQAAHAVSVQGVQTITYGAGTFLLGTNAQTGGMAYITNGRGSWQSTQVHSVSPPFTQENFVASVYGVGWKAPSGEQLSEFLLLSSSGNIFASSDGMSWELFPAALNPPGTYVAATYDGYDGNNALTFLFSLAYPTTKQHSITTSWSRWFILNYDSVEDFNGATYGKVGNQTMLVTVGSLGVIATSTNFVASGFSLQNITNSPTSENLRAVAYGNNQFVAVGDRDTILTSISGLNWTEQYSSPAQWVDLRAVAYGNDTWVAVGTKRAPDQNTIMTSRDGLTWTASTCSLCTTDLIGLAYGSQQQIFMAIGAHGEVLTSVDGLNWNEAP